MTKIVIISGTPGTGKSILAKRLVRYLPAKLADVQQIINKHHLKEFYDLQRDTVAVDITRLNKQLIKYISLEKQANTAYLIIDSHLSHYLPASCVELCIITVCDLKTLQKRLAKRNYSKAKVRENLDAEIFDVCYTEAAQRHKNILKVNTTKGIHLNTLQQIKKLL